MSICRSEQIGELFLGDTRLTDERAECAFGKPVVIGHRQAAARGVAHDDMAAGLVIHVITKFPKGLDGVCAGTDGQAAHTETSTISSAIGLGTGSLCFSRLWR